MTAEIESDSDAAEADGAELSTPTSRLATLHRIRFVDHRPSAITAIALTPSTYDPVLHYPYIPSLKSGNGRELLAVGRQNGSIEIYTWIESGQGRLGRAAKEGKSKVVRGENRQGWVLERTLAAPSPSRVEHLLFTHQTVLSESDLDLYDEQEVVRELDKLSTTRPRLFSAGGGSDLWEWDWQDGGFGYVQRTLSSQGGAIWSMACNPQGTILALGCDDGAVRLVSLWDGELEHLRKFDGVKTRLLSIAWGPMTPTVKKEKGKARETEHGNSSSSNDEESGRKEHRYEDSMVVTGCADSTVRIWDARSGRCLHRMTTDKIRGEQTLVWSLVVLSNRTIVSGDSMGLVKFWDGNMGTQTQSLKVHKADVLTLAVGPDGKSIYTSGVDQKIAQLQYVQIETQEGEEPRLQDRARWVITLQRRLHSHDVRTLAVSPMYTLHSTTSYVPLSARVPIVISGGLDFSLIFTPASTSSTSAMSINPISDSESTTFQESYHRKTNFVPHRNGPISFAREENLLVCRRERSVDIWEVKGSSTKKAWRKVLEMSLKTRTNLLASSISPNGHWLAVSDLYETKLFKLRIGSEGVYRARRSTAFAEILAAQPVLKDDMGASSLHFTSDSSKLVLGTAIGSRIVVMSLPEDMAGEASVLRVFSQHRLARVSAGRSLAGKSIPSMVEEIDLSGSDEEAASESESTSSSSRKTEDGEPNTRGLSSLACMTTSIDGQWLVTADLARRVHVYNLDALQYHSTLPSLELPPVALAFSPISPSTLVIGLPNNIIQFFEIDPPSIPPWAGSISFSLAGALSAQREPLLGLSFDPIASQKDTLLVFGSTWLARMKVPSHASKTMEGVSKKRKMEPDDDENDIVQNLNGRPAGIHTTIDVIHKYQPLLLLDFNIDGDLVVVERPFFNLLGQMAPAFVENRYGS